MSFKKIRWGVIGSGGIAQRRTIPEGIVPSQNAQLVSVYDINENVNKQVASKFKVNAAMSIQELMNENIDAVYVASPVNLHMEHVITCARAKKHVLCEKPLGLTLKEAETMVKVCKDEGVYLGTGLMMRFLAQHQEALKLIQSGKLGKPVYGRAQLSCWYPPMEGAWRQNPLTGGGGSLTDMGSHCIDLLEMFFGKIETVNCFIKNNVHNYKSEDSAIVSLKFENGALGSVDTYFCIPDNSSKNVLELYGSKGCIIGKGTIGQGTSGEMIAFIEDETLDYDAGQQRKSGEGIKICPTGINTYQAEIEEFGKAVIENREPSNNGNLGLQNQKILAACYLSAETGRSINV